jgi:hypothetical protein
VKTTSLLRNYSGMLLAFLLGAFSFSCEKVIDVDLNSADPHIVIEGSISDEPGACFVRVSQTINFDQANSFPPISGAVITISDNAGQTESLSETSPGTYGASRMQGVPGRTYTISVAVSGKTYVATSTMPFPVDIDSLEEETRAFGREESKTINVKFKDPAGVDNFYRFVEIINGVRQDFVFLIDDRLQDGSKITSILFARDNPLKSRDTIVVLLQCIDKPVFDYFRTMEQADRGGPQSASPANPLSNFTNGALGYFSAHAVRSKMVVIR